MLIVVTLYFYVFLSYIAMLVVVTLHFYVFLSEMGHVDCSHLILVCFP